MSTIIVGTRLFWLATLCAQEPYHKLLCLRWMPVWCLFVISGTTIWSGCLHTKSASSWSSTGMLHGLRASWFFLAICFRKDKWNSWFRLHQSSGNWDTANEKFLSTQQVYHTLNRAVDEDLKDMLKSARVVEGSLKHDQLSVVAIVTVYCRKH